MPEHLLDVIPAGGRDEALFKYACQLRAQGLKVSAAARLIRAAWERCEQQPGDKYPLASARAKLDQAWGYDAGATGTGTVQPAGDIGVTVRLADVEPELVDWLWPGWLPLGKLVVVDGDPNVGKSTLSVDWSARVSTGNPWPDGATCRVGDVLILSAEDGLADTIRPRLDAAGGDPQRVHALTVITSTDSDGKLCTRPPTLADVEHIETAVKRIGASLVVVDVLMAYLPGKVDAHRDQDIRSVLAGLAAMAERTRCCVLLLRHLNKSAGGSPIYRGGGSIGIIGAARAGLLAAVDPEDETRRVLACIKSNLAAAPDALGYRLVDSPQHGCASVDWLGPTGHTAAELLAHYDAGERTERDDAADFIRDYLTRNGGEAPRKDVLKAARGEHAERTLQRALHAAGVTVSRVGFPSTTVWQLTVPPVTTLDPQHKNPGATGQGGATVGIRGVQDTDDPQSRQSRHVTGVGTTDATVAGNPLCTVCGKPNLYHPDSIARGICAGCIKKLEAS